MGHSRQSQHLAEIGPLVQILHHHAIVRLEELLQDENGQELGLGERLLRKLRTIGGQGLRRHRQGRPGHCQWRAGHDAFAFCLHALLIGSSPLPALSISTEH